VAGTTVGLSGTGGALIAAGSSGAPRPGHSVADLSQERIKLRTVLGGLINKYEQTA
jgi:hypothetical protein